MLKSEMLFKRWSQRLVGNSKADELSYRAGYNAALDQIAEKCEDGIKDHPGVVFMA